MKNFSRLLALLLALCLMGGCALADLPELPASEEAEVESESVAEDTAQEDTVLAVVNGENLMQSDVDSYAYYLLYLYYSQGFDITNPELTAYIQQAAIQGSVEQAVFFQKAKELGFDQFTAEEETQLQQDAQATLDTEIENWITNNAGLAEDATDADKATARVNAIAALEAQGYTLEALTASLRQDMIYERLYADMVKDATVTDEEVRAAFDAQVEADKQTYADPSMYEQALYYFGMTPYYVPEGYRGVTQILLQVDSELMSNYQGLQASLEEAQDEAEKANEGDASATADAQATADASAEPTATPAYVSGSTPPLPLEQMKKNSSGEDVWWLQAKLKELGYYGGTVTGTYLGGTVEAVKAFQKAVGLKADGIAGAATLEKLYEQELATPTPIPTPSPTPEVIATPVATPTATATATPSPAPATDEATHAPAVQEAETAAAEEESSETAGEE